MVKQMNKLKYFLVVILMIYSFYLSDKVTNLAINKNPLMQEIKEKSPNLAVMGSNATIIDNTIIPGIKGKVVNEKESFFKMKEFGSFNETFLIYDSIKPKISLEDNLDKIIISGNKTHREVSLIIEDNENTIKYLDQLNINYTVLANLKTELLDKEYINAESNKNNFNDLESLLKKNNLNVKLCFIDYSNIELCKKKKNYLVEASIKVSNDLVLKQKNEIENGSIILINKNVSLDSLKIILDQIRYLDLDIVYLSKLITE